MDINWGVENTKNNKRKVSDVCEDDIYPKATKIPKLFSKGNKMIYTIGTTIHYTGGINSQNIETIIKQITKIINKNHKKYEDADEKLTITYIVHSFGGSVLDILKFVDFIRLTKQKYPYLEYVSVCTGFVASAGTIMATVADKRLITRSTHAMIHELSSGNSGKYTHLVSYTKHLNNLHNILCDIYMEKCNLTRDELEKLLVSETWYTAEEYLAHGFVDEIVA